MAVSANNLDALLGISGAVTDFYGAAVKSYTTSGPNTFLTIGAMTVTANDSNNLGIPLEPGESFSVTGVDDADDAITISFVIYQTVVQLQEFVVGFAQNAILLDLNNTNYTATQLHKGSNVDSTLGILSTVPITTGTALAFAATGTYSGPTSAQSVVTVSGGESAASAAGGGTYNVEVISGEAAGSVVQVTQGYQAASISGAAAITLVDTFGGVVLSAGTGNDTLLSGASADTLQAGPGNDVLVSFTGSAVETAAGETGNNLFFGGSAAVTIQGGAGHDTAVMSSGGAITTGGGGSQIWLNTGATTINDTGADTIVAGGGQETVSVSASAKVLAFAGSGAMLFENGAGPSTVAGLNSSVTIFGSAGGGTFFGGTAGDNDINSGSGPAVLIGGGNGDVLSATGPAADVLGASGGAETLNGAGSSGNDAFYGGAGSDCIIGGTGANTFTAGPGNMTLVGGGTLDLYVFLAGATSNTVIQGFNPGRDFIHLLGFSAGAAQAALTGASYSGGGTQITLSDGTRINFSGIALGTVSLGSFA